MLYISRGNLSPDGLKELERVLQNRHGDARLIRIEGNDRAFIVKTSSQVLPLFLERSRSLNVGGIEVRSVLTSGAIGKLKKRALAGRDDSDWQNS